MRVQICSFERYALSLKGGSEKTDLNMQRYQLTFANTHSGTTLNQRTKGGCTPAIAELGLRSTGHPKSFSNSYFSFGLVRYNYFPSARSLAGIISHVFV